MDLGEQQMAQQVKHAFIVTSAINSKFGVFTPPQRLLQTFDTINSIKARVPGAKIIVMECAGTSVNEQQEKLLRLNCDVFINCSNDEDVQALYDSDNWDVVKNGTEIMCFSRALSILQNEKLLDGVDRVHKMSGRYVLNDMFDLDLYEQLDLQDKIIIGSKHQSQFPIEMTTVPLQYMARLWSWPNNMTKEITDVYIQSFRFFAERLSAGGYVDIEHVLYKFLPAEHVHEVQNLGVEGMIAPNGAAIKN
jgi:hypothetical protein